jgi:AcrR family transcriptional regulator
MQCDCNAVILQHVVRGVNAGSAQRRAARIAETEERLISAATRLFVRKGYAATTLAEVAEEAGVAPRTVYVRFGTKAELLKRCVDIALVGDTAPIAVAEREWAQLSMNGPTLDVRIDALAGGAAQMFRRAGAILAVAMEAEAGEPVLERAAQAGRDATSKHLHDFWSQAAADGLLAENADVQWLGDTTALLGSAQTYLLSRKITRWNADDYESWFRTTLHRLAAAVPVVGAHQRGRAPSPG